MTTIRFHSSPNKLAAVGASIVLSGASVAGVAALGPAAAAATHAPMCAQAHHTFIDAVKATVTGSSAVVKGHPATFHCGGPDDGHYNVKKSSEKITLPSSAKVTVFKMPEDPSVTKTVAPSALPHWLKHNASEPIYRISGPKSAITKMAEQFHP